MSLIDSLLKRELEQAQKELANVVAFHDQVPGLVAEVARIKRAIAALDEPIPYALAETAWCICGHQSADHGPNVCIWCPYGISQCTKFTPCPTCL